MHMSFIFQADQRVLRQLIVTYLPELDSILKEHDIGELFVCAVKKKVCLLMIWEQACVFRVLSLLFVLQNPP